MQLIDQASAVRFIRAMAPDWVWFLKHVESEDGYVRFPALFSRFISNLKIENYPKLYENEDFIGKMMLLAFINPEEIEALDAELASLSPANRAKHVEDAMSVLMEAGEATRYLG